MTVLVTHDPTRTSIKARAKIRKLNIRQKLPFFANVVREEKKPQV
jgi:hypothetical protein